MFSVENPNQRLDVEIVLRYVYDACETIIDAFPCAGRPTRLDRDQC